MLPIFIILLFLGIGSFILIIIKKLKKKISTIKKQNNAYTNNAPDPTIPVVQPKIEPLTRDELLLNEFLNIYDSTGDFKFDSVQFRKGAKFTCDFNLAEGYKYIKKKDPKTGKEKQEMTWGYVRIHSGNDRSHGGEINGIKDVVICPFAFNRSNFIDYNGKSYGTLIQLFNDKYQFEMRIAHMHPDKNILSEVLKKIKKKEAIKRNTILGNAGNYGDSSGNHTHTEFLSLDEECEVFELLLQKMYGDKILKEYTEKEIYDFYQTQEHFKGESKRVCLEDWQRLKKEKKIIFSNKYLYRRISYDNKIHTWYNSKLLFNNL